MAGQLDTVVGSPTYGQLLQAPTDSSINKEGVVTRLDKTPVSMLDGNNGISTINSQNTYLNGVTQGTQPLPNANPTDYTKTPISTDTSGTKVPAGQATYTNQAGQEFNFSQDELNKPETQKIITDQGLVMVKKDAGITVQPTNQAQTGYDQASKDVADLTKEFLTYNVNTDPDFVAQADDIKRNYAKLTAEMQKTNEQRKAAIETLGMRGGTSQYAGSIQMGIEGEELNQANSRLSEISSQESSAISAARSAFKSNKFAEFNAKVNALKDLRDEKGKTLDRMNQALVNYSNKVKEDRTFNLAALEQIGKTGSTITPEQATKFDQSIGIPGFAQQYTEAATKAKNVADNKDLLDMQIKIAGLEKDIPLGQMGPAITMADGSTYQLKGTKVPEHSTAFKEWQDYKDTGGTLDFNAYQTMDANRKAVRSTTVYNIGGLPRQTQTAVQQIASQFDSEQVVKNYNTIAESINAVKNAGNSPTDDIQRVYAFAKIMDPNSSVREGEYKTVQDYSQAVLQAFGLKVKRVFENSGFLTTEARDFLEKTLENRLTSAEKNYKNIYSEYGRRIDKLTGQTDGTSYLTDYAKAFTNTSQGNLPESKVVNGQTYIKVDGGWQIQQ